MQANVRGGSNGSAMFIAIYRWRVKPGLEDAFRRAWRNRTEKIRTIRGSHGSRLGRESDGTLCAIALWPSREAWEATKPLLPDDDADAKTFEDAIDERLPTLTMDTLDDLWSLPQNLAF